MSLKRAVRDTVGASFAFSELIPSFNGYVVARRTFLDHADALGEDDRKDAELFFEVILELIQQAMAKTLEGMDTEMVGLIKEVWDLNKDEDLGE